MAKKKESEDKLNLQEALEEIRQRFGEGSIMKLSETGKTSHVESIPTGALSLDMALGIGGIPKGRVIEIYGPESSGKTTLALHVIAEAQKHGGVGAFIDAEHALDPDYANRIGVNVKELLISQPDSGEQALQIVEALVRSGEVEVIVIDSVAALTPKTEVAGEIGEFQIGLQARLMSSALRKLSSIVSKSGTTVIFLNQIRMKIGVMFGCFSYDTRVLLADGSKEMIGKIVNQQLPVSVLSYNFERKKFEKRPVIDWHINGETDEFLQFFVQNHTGNGRRGFSCTPDHKIYTPEGWKKAKELRVGDEIMTHITDTVFTEEQEQLVIGSLLGDGNIKQINEQTAYFREEHAPRQAEYASWLNAELGNLVSNFVPVSARGNALLETRHLLRFGEFRQLFYPEGQKIVPAQVVENITPRALAAWYCGDGSLETGLCYWKGKTYQRRPRAVLYVNGFRDSDSRKRIDAIFQKFCLSPRWRRCGEYQVLQFSVAEARKFFELIAPHVPPAMQYKLPNEYRGAFKEIMEERARRATEVQTLRAMKIKEIRRRVPYQDGQRIGRRRFDITVAGNHNYFVDECLVSNSPETTPGGLALKFYSSVRIELRRVAQIKQGDQVTGSRVRAKIVKNKVAAPFKTTEFDIYYNEGISSMADLVNTGIKTGVITKAGSWLQFEKEKVGQGLEASRQNLKENAALAKRIRTEIQKQVP